MIVYAETSALLRWLLGGSDSERIAGCLAGAERVLSSRLTVGEVRRVLVRAVSQGTLGVAALARVRAQLDAQLGAWDVLDLTEPVWIRAEDRFPVEPVRMLDALHLATALRFHEHVGEVAMLSTDGRILENWRALGLPEALAS